MTRDEFIALPPAVALRILFDALDEETAATVLKTAKEKLPLPPQWDLMIFRSGGFQWASETDLEGLQYWLGKYEKEAEAGGEYAEPNRKRALNMKRWVVWRMSFPDTVWHGKRGKKEVWAKPPTHDPKQYERKNNGGQTQRRQQHAPADEVDPSTF